MSDITPGAEVNIELTPAAEIRAEVGTSAEVNVELVPGAEVNVELVPAAEIAVELVEGPTVEVELGGSAELHFLPDGVLSGYYDRDETDALLARKAEVSALAGKADRSELESKADADHDHDARYYTEAETDALLALRVARAALLDLVYPVGAVYMSVNAASPATLFGGTWERITGRFLLAATDGGSSGASQAAGRTGGEETHYHSTQEHTLTINEIPSHQHSFNYHTYQIASGSVNRRFLSYSDSGTWNSNGTGGGSSHSHGDTGSASNMPPYLAVYVWKRTA